MASINETPEAERADLGNSRVVTASDDFATQIARIVFEWRPALVPSRPAPVDVLWMSRNVRR
jgi:hypothetical protein